MQNLMKKVWKEETGATVAEYAVLLVLILVAVYGVVKILGTRIKNLFQSVIDTIGGE